MATPRLNAYTASYEKWKMQTQDTFEFSVLVCNAVPTLKRNIRLYEKGVVSELVEPDHYGPNRELTSDEKLRRKEQLKQTSQGYKSKLSKYVLISNFSFFESYVIDVFNELISFHGGRDAFVNNARKRAQRQMLNDSADIENVRRKIRRANRTEHSFRYKAATKLLTERHYRFPSELLSGYGAQMLLQKISNARANDIPSLLRDGIHLDLSPSLIDEFHNARDLRNKIAHGESVNLTLGQVSKVSKTLRQIALKLDQHLLRYYFISELYID